MTSEDLAARAVTPAPPPELGPGADGPFTYAGLSIDTDEGVLECAYDLGGRHFVETVHVGPGWDWDAAAFEAARLVYLLAGVSYYKTSAPLVIDLAETPLRPGEADLLRAFYVEGLGEFAFRNGLDLSGLEIRGGAVAEASAHGPGGAFAGGRDRASRGGGERALIPFGGGMDSIVTVELVRSKLEDASLFILSGGSQRFEAIERAAEETGLPVLRARRDLDPQVLRSAELGFLNGHVPVTGIVSAIAVLVAVLDRRGYVVMSNERSASVATTGSGASALNHQWSKSLAFEELFARALAGALAGRVRYFSLLRPFSELWIAQRLSGTERYLRAFRSCNRAFRLEPSERLEAWCGTCDKCCFVDLVLAPFVPESGLAAIFAGREPLGDEGLRARFEALLGLGGEQKPWECVGDVEECRAALVLAASRPDRADNRLLAKLVAQLGPELVAARSAAARFGEPVGPHLIPDALLPVGALV